MLPLKRSSISAPPANLPGKNDQKTMSHDCSRCAKGCANHSVAENILRALAATGDYISGQDLAGRFKISRQALHKQIAKLQKQGYEISAVTNLGYKLCALPDKLHPAQVHSGLTTKFVGHQMDYYDEIDSTQHACWHAGLAGAPQGLVVVSETQVHGKGRMQREWISQRGGIYFSLLLKPQFLTMRDVPKLTLALGVAVCRALKCAGFNCSLKWPNDVLLAGKKVCGILCELEADIDQVHFLIAGIGINVNNSGLPPQAISLAIAAQKNQDRVKILQDVLQEIETIYLEAKKDGFAGILKAWTKNCAIWGKTVSVKIRDKNVTGIAQSIDDEGRLLLKLAAGKIEKIHSGDVII